jgi:hypothetical protein
LGAEVTLNTLVYRILTDVDSLGLPTLYHTELIELLETVFQTIKNTYKYKLSSKQPVPKTQNGSHTTPSVAADYVHIISGNIVDRVSKEKLVGIYDTQIATLTQFVSKFNSADHVLAPIFSFISESLARHASILLTQEKARRFPTTTASSPYLSREGHGYYLDEFLVRLRYRGWLQKTFHSVLQHQHGFHEHEAREFAELVCNCLSWNPGDRPSTLELSHASIFTPLKVAVPTHSLFEDTILDKHIPKHVKNSCITKTDLEQILSIPCYAADTYSCDFLPQQMILSSRNELELSIYQRGGWNTLSLDERKTLLEQRYQDFVTKYSAVGPSLRQMYEREFMYKDSLIFLNNSHLNAKFLTRFPKLSLSQSSRFYTYNILSGHLSLYSLTPLYNPITKKDITLTVLGHFCVDDGGHSNDSSSSSKDIYCIFFCEGSRIKSQNNDDIQKASKEDDERRNRYRTELIAHVSNIYHKLPEDFSQTFIQFMNDYSWFLIIPSMSPNQGEE